MRRSYILIKNILIFLKFFEKNVKINGNDLIIITFKKAFDYEINLEGKNQIHLLVKILDNFQEKSDHTLQ